MSDEMHEGGCLCGAVRYQATGPAINPHWCHCGMCRKATGAPASAWANFRLSGFDFTGGQPGWYRSSPSVRRAYCPSCGGPIATLDDGDEVICILIGSLDDPAAIQPGYHIWTENQVPWLKIEDGLPRRAR